MRTETNVKTGVITEHDDAVSDYAPPTPAEIDAENDEIISDFISQNRNIMKAIVLAINDGSIVPGSNMTPAALKAAIKAKL